MCVDYYSTQTTNLHRQHLYRTMETSHTKDNGHYKRYIVFSCPPFHSSMCKVSKIVRRVACIFFFFYSHTHLGPKYGLYWSFISCYEKSKNWGDVKIIYSFFLNVFFCVREDEFSPLS